MDTSTPVNDAVLGLQSSSNSSSVSDIIMNESKVGTLDGSPLAMEQMVAIVVPIIFGFTDVLGFAGSLLMLIVVISNKQMRKTTNLLIICFAVADLLFIVFWVPFTGIAYVMPIWLFGNIFCKIYQYMINVTAYASVYSLAFGIRLR